MSWGAYIGSAKYMGMLGFFASLLALQGSEPDPALLLDRSLWGMLGGAAVGLVCGIFLAYIVGDFQEHADDGTAQ